MGSTGERINTGGRCYKVWESGRDKKRPDIHDLPLSAETMMLQMPEHRDFPRVIIDMEPFAKWPEMTTRSRMDHPGPGSAQADRFVWLAGSP